MLNRNHENLILKTDSYKVSHWRQYPPNTSAVLSFLESRGGAFPEAVFFGLQYLIKRHLEGVVVTQEDIEEAREVFTQHFGDATLFNEAGWQHIVDKHGGRLPIRIKAVPEGSVIPISNVMMTVENTDSKVPWLTNYLETLLCQIWYPITVATQSRSMRELIMRALVETGDPALIDFKLHDFGYRGSTSDESAAIGAAAHLINFKGTDTMAGVYLASQYYHEVMAGFSIPAAEHSTITSWGRSREADAYANMLTAFPKGLVAVVSDSYDVFNACRELWGNKLKEMVLNRDGVLVVRPDSGYPPEVVVQVLDILGERFGYTYNTKGYKMLNPKVRVIQGDGITHPMLGTILEAMKVAKWSADNVAFGSGGGLLQKVDRDTMKFAFKASAVRTNGIWSDVYKDPVTDHGKKSKAGRLKLVFDNGAYKTVRLEDNNLPDQLVTVFENGELLVDATFEDIRQRVLNA